MDLLERIKRLVKWGQVEYTDKAYAEMWLDGLDEEAVEESIINASTVKSKKSNSADRVSLNERIYVIEGFTSDNMAIYTKGVIRKHEEKEVFYVLISAKRSVRGGRH